MELMNFIIKPFNIGIIKVGTFMDNTTVFGFKLMTILLWCGLTVFLFTMLETVYQHGFNTGVESAIIKWAKEKI